MIFELNRTEAKAWFADRHYTGSASGSRFFAVEENGQRLAVVAIGRGGNRFGVSDKFGLNAWRGNLEITRVACDLMAPKNAAYKSIATVLRLLASEGVEWVFSYSDTAQKHHGGIYQALNAVFVGTDAKQWVNFELNGKRVSKRLVSGKYGHTRWPDVQILAKNRGDVLERVSWKPKLTYILVIAADRRVRRQILTHLASRSLPYPKRTDDLQQLATSYRNHRPK